MTLIKEGKGSKSKPREWLESTEMKECGNTKESVSSSRVTCYRFLYCFFFLVLLLLQGMLFLVASNQEELTSQLTFMLTKIQEEGMRVLNHRKNISLPAKKH